MDSSGESNGTTSDKPNYNYEDVDRTKLYRYSKLAPQTKRLIVPDKSIFL